MTKIEKSLDFGFRIFSVSSRIEALYTIQQEGHFLYIIHQRTSEKKSILSELSMIDAGILYRFGCETLLKCAKLKLQLECILYTMNKNRPFWPS